MVLIHVFLKLVIVVIIVQLINRLRSILENQVSGGSPPLATSESVSAAGRGPDLTRCSSHQSQTISGR